MGKIQAIGWDIDGVWYKGISTSHAADASTLDPAPYLKRFVEDNGWFTYDDVRRWADFAAKNSEHPIEAVGDLAQMLTDFYYKMTKPDSDEHVVTREQIVQGKQATLWGMSLRELKKIARDVPKTPGLDKAIQTFRENEMYQAAFSDGLFPFVAYLANRMGIDYVDGVPCYVDVFGTEKLFDPTMLNDNDITLVGRVEKFNKAKAMFDHLKDMGYQLKNVAAIDDSASNIEPILKPVQEAGGIAIGFNPTEAHLPKFKEAGIPVLIQGEERSLEPFIEIVQDPSEATIGRYCV